VSPRRIAPLVRREIAVRSATPWYPILVTLAGGLFAFLAMSQWRFVTERGIAVGSLVTTPLVLGLGLLLLGATLEAASSIPQERATASLQWLMLSPVRSSEFVVAKLLGTLVVVGAASAVMILVAFAISSAAGLAFVPALAGVALPFVATVLHVTGLGLLIGSLARSVRGATFTVLALVLAGAGLALVDSLLAARPASGPFDPAAIAAIAIDRGRAAATVLLPTTLLVRADAAGVGPERAMLVAAALAQGVLGTALAAWRLGRTGGRS
jgi:ABC-type Na+ efflux pump permease subunit